MIFFRRGGMAHKMDSNFTMLGAMLNHWDAYEIEGVKSNYVRPLKWSGPWSLKVVIYSCVVVQVIITKWLPDHSNLLCEALELYGWELVV